MTVLTNRLWWKWHHVTSEAVIKAHAAPTGLAGTLVLRARATMEGIDPEAVLHPAPSRYPTCECRCPQPFASSQEKPREPFLLWNYWSTEPVSMTKCCSQTPLRYGVISCSGIDNRGPDFLIPSSSGKLKSTNWNALTVGRPMQSPLLLVDKREAKLNRHKCCLE